MFLDKSDAKEYPGLHDYLTNVAPWMVSEDRFLKAIVKYGNFASDRAAGRLFNKDVPPRIRVGDLDFQGRYKQGNLLLELDTALVEDFEFAYPLAKDGREADPKKRYYVRIKNGDTPLKLLVVLWSIFVALGDDINNGPYGPDVMWRFQTAYYGRDLRGDVKPLYITKKRP